MFTTAPLRQVRVIVQPGNRVPESLKVGHKAASDGDDVSFPLAPATPTSSLGTIPDRQPVIACLARGAATMEFSTHLPRLIAN